MDRDTVSSFIKEDSASAEILKEMAAEAKNEDLAVSLRTSGLFHSCCFDGFRGELFHYFALCLSVACRLK